MNTSDFAAGSLTLACALHCVALPAAAPSLATLVALEPRLELSLRFALTAFSLGVLIVGARATRDLRPLLLGGVATLLLTFGRSEAACCAQEEGWAPSLRIGVAAGLFLLAHGLNALNRARTP